MPAMSTQSHPAKILRTAVVAALLAVLGATSALADTPASATAASALLEATANNGMEQMNQSQATGYDWTLAVAFLFGVVGLVWMRRHISRL